HAPVTLWRAAILAANPHNSQPWLFRVSDTRIDLFAAANRNLGSVDPYSRELYIGLGCALENLLLAAQAEGYAFELSLMPDATRTDHVARVDLSSGKLSSSDLYQAIPNR